MERFPARAHVRGKSSKNPVQVDLFPILLEPVLLVDIINTIESRVEQNE
jgi:hypothetical protein